MKDFLLEVWQYGNSLMNDFSFGIVVIWKLKKNYWLMLFLEF